MTIQTLLAGIACTVAAALSFAACSPSGGSSAPLDHDDSHRQGVTDCSGSYGTTPAADGKYDATSFGCWVDEGGKSHSDSGDNCIPACLSKAQQSLCQGMDGPECERSINWYSADAARYGCMTRLRITNPANGRAAIVVALDYGPSCSLENQVDKPLMDLSYRVTEYLFGGAVGYKEGAAVDVVVVDGNTPLGPTDGSAGSGSSSTGGGSTGSGGSGAPDGWTCDPAWYGDAYCDCDCGAADPDCAAGVCDGGSSSSSGSGGGGAPADWTCDPAWYADAYCDCDCGADDPDCGAGDCSGSSSSGSGGGSGPDGWTCDPTWYGDGVYCDCDCGVPDIDCGAGQCG